MFLTGEEEKRYSRQLTGMDFSVRKQEMLKGSSVLVAGVGGLGGTVALHLACAGIGRLIIVHAGNLELPDMNRQLLMSTAKIGRPRVEIARERLVEINPNVEVIAFDEWITWEKAEQYIQISDLIIDCRHNFEERAILNRAAVKHGKPMVEGGMDDMCGYITSIKQGETPCLSCLFMEFPKWDPMGFAVMGVIPGTLAGLMALEAIKILTGTGTPLYSRLLTFDGLTYDFVKHHLKKNPDCKVCGEKYEHT